MPIAGGIFACLITVQRISKVLIRVLIATVTLLGAPPSSNSVQNIILGSLMGLLPPRLHVIQQQAGFFFLALLVFRPVFNQVDGTLVPSIAPSNIT